MSEAYLCPHCNTNRTWFNQIEQVSTSVKKDPNTGEVVEQLLDGGMPPYAFAYNGPHIKVQCGICGLIGEEEMFIRSAQNK